MLYRFSFKARALTVIYPGKSTERLQMEQEGGQEQPRLTTITITIIGCDAIETFVTPIIRGIEAAALPRLYRSLQLPRQGEIILVLGLPMSASTKSALVVSSLGCAGSCTSLQDYDSL